MNIKDEYIDEMPNSIRVMEEAMNYLWATFIAPQESTITDEQADMLILIGVSLQEMAKKADSLEAYSTELKQFQKN